MHVDLGLIPAFIRMSFSPEGVCVREREREFKWYNIVF